MPQQPPVTASSHLLPFNRLSAETFERLCLWLVKREGFTSVQYLGEAGSDQGRDLVAYRGGQRYAFQCKRVARFGPREATQEIAKLRSLPASEWPDEVVFVVVSPVSAKTRRTAWSSWGSERGCHFWTGAELDERVKRYPDLLREFFLLPPAILPPALERSMAQRPAGFVPRRELETLVSRLTAPTSGDGEVLTALHGAGGFGKTTLARAACYDERVRARFDDGILWTTMSSSLSDADRMARIRDLGHWWTGERPAPFETLAATAADLRDRLRGQRVLLVVDDIWRRADLEPFRGLGGGAAILATTRDRDALPADCDLEAIGAMSGAEGAAILGRGLSGFAEPALYRLAQRLSHWPLLLGLVNAQLRTARRDGLNPTAALRRVHQRLAAGGLTAFDRRDPEARSEAVSLTMAASLDALAPGERERFVKLAVFPSDLEIPLAPAAALWGLSLAAAEDLCGRLHDLSLLGGWQPEPGRFSVHAVIRQYLLGAAAEAPPALHRELLAACRPLSGGWAALPLEHLYLWQHLARHLTAADLSDELDISLTDFDFLQAKLLATGELHGVLADFSLAAEWHCARPGVSQEEQAAERELAAYAAQITSWDSAEALPEPPESYGPGRRTGLRLTARPPGSARLRDYASFVAAQLPWLQKLGDRHGFFAQHGANTGPETVRADAMRWIEQRLRRGPLLVDRSNIAGSGPSFQKLLFDAQLDRVDLLCVSLDGKQALMGSREDRTGFVRLWNLERAVCTREMSLGEHIGCLAMNGDARVAIFGAGSELRLLNLETGGQTVLGTTGWVQCVALTPSGDFALSVGDETVTSWDVSRRRTRVVLPAATHRPSGSHACMSADGSRIVCCGTDLVISHWDLERHRPIGFLWPPSTPTCLAVSASGEQLLSGHLCGKVCLWDVGSRSLMRTVDCGSEEIRQVLFTADDRKVVALSSRSLAWFWLSGPLAGDPPRGIRLAETFDHATVDDQGSRVVVARAEPPSIELINLDSAASVWQASLSGPFLTASALSPDGSRVAVHHGDSLVVYDAVGAGRESAHQHYEGLVYALLWTSPTICVLSSNRPAAEESLEYRIDEWSIDRGEVRQLMHFGDSHVTGEVAAGHGELAFVGNHDHVIVADILAGTQRQSDLGDNWVSCISPAPGGTTVFLLVEKHFVRVFDGTSGERVHDLSLALPAHSIAMDPGGRRAVIGGWRGVHVLEVAAGLLETIDYETYSVPSMSGGGNAWIEAIDITADGRRSISVHHDDTVRTWDLVARSSTAEWYVPEAITVGMSADGRIAATGLANGRLAVWDANQIAAGAIPRGHTWYVFDLAVSPDRRWLVSANGDSTIQILDLLDPERLPITRKGHHDKVLSVSISPDSLHAISASQDDQLCIWELATGSLVEVFQKKAGANESRALYTADPAIVVAGDDLSQSAVCVWRRGIKEPVAVLQWNQDGEGCTALAVTPDSRFVAAALEDEWVCIYDLAYGTTKLTLNETSLQLEFSPDGRMLLCQTGLAGVLVDVMTGETIANVPGVSFCFSPDARWIAVGTDAGLIQVFPFPPAGGEAGRQLLGHTARVGSLSASSDGRRLISGSRDATARLWDVREGECLGVHAMSAPVHKVLDLGPSGRFAIGTDTGEVHVVRLRNVDLGVPIVTGVRLWHPRPEESWAREITFVCAWCGERSPLKPLAGRRGRRSRRNLNGGNCQHCGKELAFTPFVIDHRAWPLPAR